MATTIPRPAYLKQFLRVALVVRAAATFAAIVNLAVISGCAQHLSTTDASARPTSPRSARDVLQMLRDHQPDPHRIAEIKAAATVEPAPELTGEALALFYANRGRSAWDLGNAAQASTDLRRAIALFGPAKHRQKMIAQGVLHHVLGQSSRFSEAFEVLEAVRQDYPDMPWVHGLRTEVLASLGRFAEAQAAMRSTEAAAGFGLRTSATSMVTHPAYWIALMDGHVNWAKGSLLFDQGQAREAEIAFRQALKRLLEAQRFEPGRDPAFSGPDELQGSINRARTRLARTLLRLGRAQEAEWETRQGLISQLKLVGRNATATASMTVELARVLSARGEFEEAIALSREAINTGRRLGVSENSITLLNAQSTLVSALNGAGQYQEAAETVIAIRNTVANETLLQAHSIHTNPEWILALAMGGHSAAAKDLANEAVERMTQRGLQNHPDHTMALALRAVLHDSTTLNELRSLITSLQLRASQRDGERGDNLEHARHFKFVAEGLLALLAKEIASSRTDPSTRTALMDEALMLAESLRQGLPERAIAANFMRIASADPALASLIRDEQDLRLRLRALNDVVLSPVSTRGNRPSRARPPANT
jgi:tetratricopeptide (TPR) repeat protein